MFLSYKDRKVQHSIETNSQTFTKPGRAAFLLCITCLSESRLAVYTPFLLFALGFLSNTIAPCVAVSKKKYKQSSSQSPSWRMRRVPSTSKTCSATPGQTRTSTTLTLRHPQRRPAAILRPTSPARARDTTLHRTLSAAWEMLRIQALRTL